jgi:hypothetical protein
MGKVLLWIGGIFAPIGLIFAAIGVWLHLSSASLYETGVYTKGRVTELASQFDSDDNSYSYKPVVEFADAEGQRHQFTGSISSSPPAYAAGDTVEVVYAAGDPQSATVDDFLTRYLLPLVFGGLGTIFVCIGAALIVVYLRRQRDVADLRASGVPIPAQLLECYRDTSIAINGRHPFRVACQAVHPATGRLERFESEPVWVDPTAAIGNAKITVLVDPRRPGMNFVDLSPWVGENDRL